MLENLQVRSPEQHIMEFSFAPVSARCVRVVLTEDTADEGWTIDEVYPSERPMSDQPQ